MRNVVFVLQKARISELVTHFRPVEFAVINGVLLELLSLLASLRVVRIDCILVGALRQIGQQLLRFQQIRLRNKPLLLSHGGHRLDVGDLRDVRASRELFDILIAKRVSPNRETEIRIQRQPAENRYLAQRRRGILLKDLVKDHDGLPLFIHVRMAAGHAEINGGHIVRHLLKFGEELLRLFKSRLYHFIIRPLRLHQEHRLLARALDVLIDQFLHRFNAIFLELDHHITRANCPIRFQCFCVRANFQQVIAELHRDGVEGDQVFDQMNLLLEFFQQIHRLVCKLVRSLVRRVMLQRVERHESHRALRRNWRVEFRIIHELLKRFDFVFRLFELTVAIRLSRQRVL